MTEIKQQQSFPICAAKMCELRATFGPPDLGCAVYCSQHRQSSDICLLGHMMCNVETCNKLAVKGIYCLQHMILPLSYTIAKDHIIQTDIQNW